jgi:hypothetical protein
MTPRIVISCTIGGGNRVRRFRGFPAISTAPNVDTTVDAARVDGCATRRPFHLQLGRAKDPMLVVEDVAPLLT